MRNSTANAETITVARPLLEFAAGFDTGILGLAETLSAAIRWEPSPLEVSPWQQTGILLLKETEPSDRAGSKWRTRLAVLRKQRKPRSWYRT